ncbi:MAG TPA: hypothetical protein VK638_52550 [Edaphobacter sp.]|nr:hypothetical protein [Edaphobacter sp.]
MASQRTMPIQVPPDMVWIPAETFRMGSEGFYPIGQMNDVPVVRPVLLDVGGTIILEDNFHIL